MSFQGAGEGGLVDDCVRLGRPAGDVRQRGQQKAGYGPVMDHESVPSLPGAAAARKLAFQLMCLGFDLAWVNSLVGRLERSAQFQLIEPAITDFFLVIPAPRNQPGY